MIQTMSPACGGGVSNTPVALTGDPGASPGLRSTFVTGRYCRFTPSRGVPIRTSVGGHRWFKYKDDLVHARLSSPYGVFKVYEDQEEYRLHYLANLNDRRDAVLAELDALASGGVGVLMCFCDLAKGWCHRTMLGQWIEQETGLVVPELDPA